MMTYDLDFCFDKNMEAIFVKLVYYEALSAFGKHAKAQNYSSSTQLTRKKMKPMQYSAIFAEIQNKILTGHHGSGRKVYNNHLKLVATVPLC
jgi:hypothetical protein